MRMLIRLLVFVGVATAVAAGEQVWRLDNLQELGGHKVITEGAPQVVAQDGGKAVAFDGVKDGLFVPAIPFAGAAAFTIEILFHPAEGGPKEQRFLHAEDTQGSRALLETRLDGRGGWWLDTFIVNAEARNGVTLIDPRHLHPTGRWYWAALRYDGRSMAHFVNGRKELESAAKFTPFSTGRISLGVRQNKVYWFKGIIREVRFHTEAVADSRLQRVTD